MIQRPSPAASIVLNAVGLGLVIGGWFGVSAQGTWSAQLPYLNIAVAGVLVASLGNALVLLGWLRTIDERYRRLADRRRVPASREPTP